MSYSNKYESQARTLAAHADIELTPAQIEGYAVWRAMFPSECLLKQQGLHDQCEALRPGDEPPCQQSDQKLLHAILMLDSPELAAKFAQHYSHIFP